MPNATSHSAKGRTRGGKMKNPTGGETMAETTESRSSEEGSTPIVLERTSKGGRRYSTGLKNVQVSERHLSRAIHRVARSLENGLEAYEEARDESANSTRDGAIVEFIPNVAEGLSSVLETLTPLPQDLAKALYPTRARRVVRSASRLVGGVFDMSADDDDDDDDDDDLDNED